MYFNSLFSAFGRAFIAQEIALGEDVWQNSWKKFQNLSDPNKLQTIGAFHFTLQRVGFLFESLFFSRMSFMNSKSE